jgi:hypothetical protein
MRDANVMPLAEALARWHDFYMLLGTASATLVGLLFVAATVGAGVFTSSRPAPLRVFLSSSVVHFSTTLVGCLIVQVPEQTWVSLGTMIAGCGIFGLGYHCMAWRDSIRDGVSKSMALDDRIWYGVLPVASYIFETGAGITLALRSSLGCAALALSMGMLLMVGIHNAWDITVWSITRPQK